MGFYLRAVLAAQKASANAQRQPQVGVVDVADDGDETFQQAADNGVRILQQTFEVRAGDHQKGGVMDGARRGAAGCLVDEGHLAHQLVGGGGADDDVGAPAGSRDFEEAILNNVGAVGCVALAEQDFSTPNGDAFVTGWRFGQCADGAGFGAGS